MSLLHYAREDKLSSQSKATVPGCLLRVHWCVQILPFVGLNVPELSLEQKSARTRVERSWITEFPYAACDTPSAYLNEKYCYFSFCYKSCCSIFLRYHSRTVMR